MAQTTYQRGQNLYKEGVISRQRRDEMQAAAVSAAQMTEASYQQYARAKRGSTPQQQSSADAQVKIAQAALAEANALEAGNQIIRTLQWHHFKNLWQSFRISCDGCARCKPDSR